MTATPYTCAHMTDFDGCVWHTRNWSPAIVPKPCEDCPKMAQQDRLVDCVFHAETDSAILVSEFGVSAAAVWLPKSQITYETGRAIGSGGSGDRWRHSLYECELVVPEWLAEKNGIDW